MVWYGAFSSTVPTSLIHLFIHSFTHPALSFPHGHNPEMLSLLVETGSEAAGYDIRSPFCKTRQNAVQLATRHIT